MICRPLTWQVEALVQSSGSYPQRVMTTAVPKKKATNKRTVSRKADAVTVAEKAVEEHPELVARLNEGDPGALLELFEAAGGKVGTATLKVVARRSAAAG
jgi:hypothetical protein